MSLSLTVATIFKTLRNFLTCYGECFYQKERPSKPRVQPRLNSDLSYPLSLTTTLPHRPAKIPKNLSTSTRKLSLLTGTSITGDPSPFHNFSCQFNVGLNVALSETIKKRITCLVVTFSRDYNTSIITKGLVTNGGINR